MRLRTIACAVMTVMLLAFSIGSATATTAPTHLKRLAQQQTNLALKFYEGQNVSPPKCGQGQGSKGVDGVFLLPVPLFTPGDRTINCKTSARSVLVDLGGFVLTEDNRSSWTLENGQSVPFTRNNLEPICKDIIKRDFEPVGAKGKVPVPATLDGVRSITGSLINSGVFRANVNRNAPTFYADSVDLGHPGRLATVYCGSKAKVHLSPGTHTIVVDYSGLFGGTAGGENSTVFTYNIKVKRHHSH